MKKPLTALSLAGILLFTAMGLFGCQPAESDDKFSIVTTVYATYDLAKQLTAEFTTECEVSLLLTPGGESHAYEPSPADAAMIQSCDLFVYIGGTSEQWAEKLIQKSRQEKQNLRLFDKVSLLSDEDGDEFDEHIWTAPKNADSILLAVKEALAQALPEESSGCELAYDRLHGELCSLDEQARDISAREKRNTLVFADRFPFRYLTEAYGWHAEAAFSGCGSDTEASAATLSALIETVQSEQIHTIFVTENSTTKIADAIEKATGAKTVTLQSCNNVTAEDFQAGVHYQDLMRQNLTAIEEALC